MLILNRMPLLKKKKKPGTGGADFLSVDIAQSIECKVNRRQ